MEIVIENGIKWGVKKEKIYGVWHYTKYNLGKVEKTKPEQKKIKKEADE